MTTTLSVYNKQYVLFIAVRLNRVRGGRNKFGALYKQDRAMKRQISQQRMQIMATLDEVSSYTWSCALLYGEGATPRLTMKSYIVFVLVDFIFVKSAIM